MSRFYIMMEQNDQLIPSPLQVVEKVVEVKVEDPELKSQVEKLAKENAQLKSQVCYQNTRIQGCRVYKYTLKLLFSLICFKFCFQVEDLKRSSSASDSKRVSELEQEVQAVNEKVVHYQTVLADTVSNS